MNPLHRAALLWSVIGLAAYGALPWYAQHQDTPEDLAGHIALYGGSDELRRLFARKMELGRRLSELRDLSVAGGAADSR